MTKVVSSTQLKQNTGEIVSYVIENKETVIIERYSIPKAVIVDFESYEQMAQAQRDQVFDRLRQAADRVAARVADLSEAERAQLVSDAIAEYRTERRADQGDLKGSSGS